MGRVVTLPRQTKVGAKPGVLTAVLVPTHRNRQRLADGGPLTVEEQQHGKGELLVFRVVLGTVWPPT